MYKKIKAIRIKQPFSEFFAFSMKAKDLLQVCYSDPIRYTENGELTGSQRKLSEGERMNSITRYINSNDLALPNSIVIAANYNSMGFIEEDSKLRWSIKKIENEDDLFEITIPTNSKLATVVDGQHRLFSFSDAIEIRQETDLLVSAYFDVPLSFQAFIFATINYNQKPVSKSLALEQFGYYLETNKPETWTPELLGVFFSRKLNLDLDSPFYNRVKVAPQDDENLLDLDQRELDWKISMSTLVLGIIKLFTSNAKRDADEMAKYDFEIRNRELLNQIIDKSVLRKYYLEGNDLFIYKIINNFFIAVNEILFTNTQPKSYIKKTTGISALFKLLELLIVDSLNDQDISIAYFKEKINLFKDIDFSNTYFQSPSSSGTSRILNTFKVKLGIINVSSLKNSDDSTNISKILNIPIE